MINAIVTIAIAGVCYLAYRTYVNTKKIRQAIKENRQKQQRKKANNLVYDEKTDSYVPEDKSK